MRIISQLKNGFRKIRCEYFDNILGSDNCKVNYFFVFNMRCFFFELENFFRVFRVQKRTIFLRIFNPKLRFIAFQSVYVKINRAFKNEFYFFAFLIFEFHNKSFVIPFYIFEIKCSARVVYFVFLKYFHVAPSSHIYFNPFYLIHQENLYEKSPASRFKKFGAKIIFSLLQIRVQSLLLQF